VTTRTLAVPGGGVDVSGRHRQAIERAACRRDDADPVVDGVGYDQVPGRIRSDAIWGIQLGLLRRCRPGRFRSSQRCSTHARCSRRPHNKTPPGPAARAVGTWNRFFAVPRPGPPATVVMVPGDPAAADGGAAISSPQSAGTNMGRPDFPPRHPAARQRLMGRRKWRRSGSRAGMGAARRGTQRAWSGARCGRRLRW
jgi:hypothetical protein